MDNIHNAAKALPNLNRIAYREIEELIVTLQLAPGAVLSEADLARRLGISRTPVREALQRLAREGLVRIMPRRGLLVTEVNIEKQLRMLDARREIERFLARHAAERRIDDERRMFLAVAEALAEAGAGRDEVAFTRADRPSYSNPSQCMRPDHQASLLARRLSIVAQSNTASMGIIATNPMDGRTIP